MAEWLYEAGIGEARAALIEDGRIVKARIELDDGAPRVGAILRAQLLEPPKGRLVRVKLEGGEAMLEHAPRTLTQGASLIVEIVREAIPERGRPKLAKAVPAPGAEATPGPDLLARITGSGLPVRHCLPHQPDALEAAGGSETLAEASDGEIAFEGGSLRLAVTPAMSLCDVDGAGALDRLAVDAADAAARASVRLGIGGSIGIDFPTLANKAERIAVAEAIDAALPLPFDRTAVNGFGFLQIIRPRLRASLPELLAADIAAAEARALLRRIEREPPAGARSHRVSPRVHRALEAHPHWRADLARRTGTSHLFEIDGAQR
ncbi:hypothetical protein BH09PSE4_BH09PSE4_19100 [soil metagenome]